MLKDIRDSISNMISSGYSLSEILNSKPTEKYDAIYGQSSFIKPNDFIKAIYQSLNR
jgi:hypothetical protein